MNTDQKTMAAADWDRVERETVQKIRLLKTAVKGMQPGPLSDKVCNELVLPAMARLAAFNHCVTVGHSDHEESMGDVPPPAAAATEELNAATGSGSNGRTQCRHAER